MEEKKNNKTILWTIAIIVLIIAFLFVLFRGGSESDKTAVDKPQSDTSSIAENSENIDFELKNYDGEVVTFRDIKNDVVVLNAWASWCPFCVNELPDFAMLQEEFSETVSVVAINRAEPLATAKSFSDSINLSDKYTFLVDPDDTFYKSIGGFSMPETLFLNKKGEILLHKRGPMKIEEMRDVVNAFLNN